MLSRPSYILRLLTRYLNLNRFLTGKNSLENWELCCKDQMRTWAYLSKKWRKTWKNFVHLQRNMIGKIIIYCRAIKWTILFQVIYLQEIAFTGRKFSSNILPRKNWGNTKKVLQREPWRRRLATRSQSSIMCHMRRGLWKWKFLRLRFLQPKVIRSQSRPTNLSIDWKSALSSQLRN